MTFKIRPATADDVDSILELIHELAVYEKEPLAVKTTREDPLRDGFGATPYFHCLVADNGESISGFALYFLTWSTWEGRPSLYLEDLFVKSTARGHGLGFSLFQNLAKIALEKKCQRFEWAVLDWNQPARDFYHGLGAFHMKGWLPYRMEGAKIKEIAEATN